MRQTSGGVQGFLPAARRRRCVLDPFWTSVLYDDNGTGIFQTGSARFAFTAGGESQFNLYNVHLHPGTQGSLKAAVDLVTSFEALKYTARTAYPPIMVGDFNGLDAPDLPEFDNLGNVDVDLVLGGRRSSYPSDWRFKVVRTAVLPGVAANPDGMCAPRDVAWSDHCALLVDIEPTD